MQQANISTQSYLQCNQAFQGLWNAKCKLSVFSAMLFWKKSFIRNERVSLKGFVEHHSVTARTSRVVTKVIRKACGSMSPGWLSTIDPAIASQVLKQLDKHRKTLSDLIDSGLMSKLSEIISVFCSESRKPALSRVSKPSLIWLSSSRSTSRSALWWRTTSVDLCDLLLSNNNQYNLLLSNKGNYDVLPLPKVGWWRKDKFLRCSDVICCSLGLKHHNDLYKTGRKQVSYKLTTNATANYCKNS